MNVRLAKAALTATNVPLKLTVSVPRPVKPVKPPVTVSPSVPPLAVNVTVWSLLSTSAIENPGIGLAGVAVKICGAVGTVLTGSVFTIVTVPLSLNASSLKAGGVVVPTVNAPEPLAAPLPVIDAAVPSRNVTVPPAFQIAATARPPSATAPPPPPAARLDVIVVPPRISIVPVL